MAVALLGATSLVDFASVPALAGARAPIPAKLAGTYVANFSGKERTSNGPSGSAIAAGAWTLVLRGSSALFTNPQADVTFPIGKPVSVVGNRITFGPDTGCPDQKPPATRGVYMFTLQGKTLRFRKVADSCNNRAATLTAHAWTKLPG